MREDLKNLLGWVKEYDLDVKAYSAKNFDANLDNEFFLIEWLMEQGFDASESAQIEEYYQTH